MNFSKTDFSGLILISPNVFNDDRGCFFESFNALEFEANGILETFVQDNVSKSKKNVVRGLHFQNPPYAQGKLVSVLQGSVLDVVVDIRKFSDTYGQTFTVELSESNRQMLYVPVGFAHGFVALEDNTVFSYKCTNNYNKASESGILWNDPTLNIDWHVENPIVSGKDLILPLFADLNSLFV